MFKKLLSSFTAAVLLFSASANAADVPEGTDNSGLLKYTDSENAEYNRSYSNGAIDTPDWADSLIIVEVRPDTASIGGTLAECYDLLDFYAGVGINGIWLSPIYERTAGGNGYSNCGPHTLEPAIVGTSDVEKGWQEVGKFVDYAHSKGIYVFLDVITWGVVRGAPIIDEHPDWFNGEAWGNVALDWSNIEMREWFTETLVDNILKTDADGFRCDCEPNHSGYDMYKDVRERLDKKAKKIIIISEDYGTRNGAYDFEQDGVMNFKTHSRADLYQNPVNFFADGYLNIVDTVRKGTGEGYPGWQGSLKAGTGKYYTNCITNHDFQKRNICGSRIKIGYSAIFAPFIPVWYMGDEFNAFNNPGVLYDLPVDFSEMYKEENAAFLNDVRKMIRIRRTFSDIFEYWPVNHRNSNICKVETEGLGTLQAYGRYAGNEAVLIVANNSKDSTQGMVKVPFSGTGLNFYKNYTVTDLFTGKTVAVGSRKDIGSFGVTLPYDYVGAYLVEAENPESSVLVKTVQFLNGLPDRIFSLVCSILWN